MGKLVRLLVTQENYLPISPAENRAYQSRLIYSVVADGVANAVLNYKKLDGTNNLTINAASTPAAIATAMNVANTTDVNAISLTVIKDDLSTYVRTFDPFFIFKVIADPSDSAHSIIMYTDTVETQNVRYVVNETLANIITAANA